MRKAFNYAPELLWNLSFVLWPIWIRLTYNECGFTAQTTLFTLKRGGTNWLRVPSESLGYAFVHSDVVSYVKYYSVFLLVSWFESKWRFY